MEVELHELPGGREDNRLRNDEGGVSIEETRFGGCDK